MGQFGEALGMAFQIQDDMLDFRTDTHTGKPACNDLREGKITLPLLIVLERVDETRRAELLERLGRCHDDETSVEYLRAIVANEGGLDEAGRVMQEYIARAVGLLSEYEDSDVS